MTLPDFQSVRKIWDDRKISSFVLVSLSLQILLTVCAPLRKRTSRMWIMSTIIWLAYIVADLVANYAIVLIASSQCSVLKPALSTEVQLLAFWAPFLLIHLGGPDTITSFALKDNALWLRHFLGPLFQVVATLNVFLQSLGPTNKLRFPTLALFLIGIIKCSERTRALYLGSFDGLKNSVKEDGLENSVKDCLKNSVEGPKNIRVVQCAYGLFERFSKVLIADLLYKSRDNMCQMDSASFFHRISPEESFHIIAAELNFIYETLFTKLYVAHTKPGYFFRAMSFGATSIALVCFHKFDKHDLDRLDVVITYSLICGAMALDSIALFMLIFSDWTVAFAAPKDGLQSKNYWQSCWETILVKYLDLKKPNLYSSNTSSFLRRSRQILFGRSSESIYTFNLIDYALQESSPPTSCGIFFLQKIGLFIGCLQHFRQRLSSCGCGGSKRGSLFRLKDLLDKIKYGFMLSSTPFSKDLWEFIFIDLSEKKTNNRDLWDATGGWIGGCPGLIDCVRDRDYEDNLILWHIATTICYNTDKSNAGDGNPPREYSKTLSDYMFYLLLMQPTLMSSVTTIGKEALLSHTLDAIAKICSRDSEPREVLKREEAFERILGVNPSISNKCTINVEPSKPPLLFLARDLAKELTKLEDKKWDVISLVWVYLLSYAATHCRPSSYAQLLSNGGELVAFVWLLMEHLEVRRT